MIGANDKIRICIVGCGFIANQKHMPSLKLLDNVEMVGFCDLVIEKAEEARAKYGAPGAKVYTEYKKMLDSLAVGNRVLAAGIYGTIKKVGEETIDVEIAKGVVVTVAKNAVANVEK